MASLKSFFNKTIRQRTIRQHTHKNELHISCKTEFGFQKELDRFEKLTRFSICIRILPVCKQQDNNSKQLISIGNSSLESNPNDCIKRLYEEERTWKDDQVAYENSYGLSLPLYRIQFV